MTPGCGSLHLKWFTAGACALLVFLFAQEAYVSSHAAIRKTSAYAVLSAGQGFGRRTDGSDTQLAEQWKIEKKPLFEKAWSALQPVVEKLAKGDDRLLTDLDKATVICSSENPQIPCRWRAKIDIEIPGQDARVWPLGENIYFEATLAREFKPGEEQATEKQIQQVITAAIK